MAGLLAGRVALVTGKPDSRAYKKMRSSTIVAHVVKLLDVAFASCSCFSLTHIYSKVCQNFRFGLTSN